MNKYIFLIILLFALVQGFSQSISLEWITLIEGGRSAITGSYIRENGNILVRGFYQEYLAVETDTIISESDAIQDSYLIELDSKGEYNWSERFAYTTGEVYHKIASYKNQIYNQGKLVAVTTPFNGVNFDSLNVGQNDKIYATPGYDLSIDGEGNLYVTGYFSNTVDFEPGPNQTILTALNSIDACVAKYDSERNLIWARSFPGRSAEEGTVVTSDINQNVYMAANFRDSIDIDLDTDGFELPNSNSQDDSYYLTKFTPNGALKWYKPLNGVGRNTISSIAVDKDYEITIVGGFRDEFIYEIDGDIDTLHSKGQEDIYVARLDSMGNFIWINHIGGKDDQYGLSTIINKQGYIFVLGSFYGPVSFNPYLDNMTVSKGFSDSFILIYDKNGNYITHYTYGGIGFDWARSIHFDKDDNLILISSVGGELDADLGLGEYIVSPTGFGMSFISKYTYCLPSANQEYFSICEGEELIVNGIAYNAEGVYTQTLVDQHQCDSTIIINLTISESYRDTIIASVCEGEELIVNGISYNAEGVYTQTLVDQHQCDSTIIINLTISESFRDTIIASICQGDTLLGYTEEGAYEIVRPSSVGCDSILLLNLSFLPESDPLCLTTNSIETDRNNKIQLSPVPLIDICFIKSHNPIEKIVILNLTGMVISTFNKVIDNQIDVSHLPTGVYLFYIIDKKGIQVIKAMKI